MDILFTKPTKQINDPEDMESFKESIAYARILDLINKLSSVVTLKECPSSSTDPSTERLLWVLDQLSILVDQIPPATGPRRFGNISFRTWHKELKQKGSDLVTHVLGENSYSPNNSPLIELEAYFQGAFGSKQRLDYGTGHELNFLVFIGGLLYIEVLDPKGTDILLIFERYFQLCRKLIITYNLEPAGSHGVWGLDDHFHLPYILGSAQIVDISRPDYPTPEIPPKAVLDKKLMNEKSHTNLYFSAINFIYQVKKGPFFEHSPILFDVTAVPTWHKIHRGMIKMYAAEVLGKFPVVQHFEFGTALFPWIPK